MGQTKRTAEEITHATERLRQLLPTGATIYTNTVHRSASGMLRLLRVYCAVPADPTNSRPYPEILDITGYCAMALDRRCLDSGGRTGIPFRGCNYSAGDELREHIAHLLHGKGEGDKYGNPVRKLKQEEL